jgi:hypothetical protein
MENRWNRFVSLALRLAAFVFMGLAFFLKDHRLFIALAVLALAFDEILIFMKEVVMNRKTVFIAILAALAITLALVAGFAFFSGR